MQYIYIYIYIYSSNKSRNLIPQLLFAKNRRGKQNEISMKITFIFR